MWKIFAYVFLISLGFLAIFNFSYASSRSFGGTVIETKASKIKEAEDAGYKCKYKGKTLEIELISGINSGFYIPLGIRSLNDKNLSIRQYILGTNTALDARIKCTKEGDVIIVKLKNINKYGNH